MRSSFTRVSSFATQLVKASSITSSTRFVNNVKMAASTISGDTESEPLYFWREFEEPYGFLSQWYESPFEVDGVTYQTAEMWMMIQKAKLFGDEVSLADHRGIIE